jgi:hypothetical protein
MGDLPKGWHMKDFKKIEIPPEHKGSLGDTFKYMQDKVLEPNTMGDRLQELKTVYKDMASGKPNDRFMQEVAKEAEARLKERETLDLQVPHKCDAAYIYHPVGAELDQIEPFTTELTEVVDTMKEQLLNEKRLLEGTDVPQYNENELSNFNPLEQQWKSDSPNGCSTTDPTLTSTQDSNILSGFAELFNRNCPMPPLRRQSTNSLTSSCSEMSVDCGTEIDAMNECSECTVPMTSELMLGTPNEEKWSPPPKSTESLDQTLPDEMS